MNDMILKTSLGGLCALGKIAGVALLPGTDLLVMHAVGSRNEQYTHTQKNTNPN